MVTTRVSVVLIDDNLVAREGIVALIRSQPGFQVLAASANIEDALQQVQETGPDLVLLNLRREGEDSLTMAGLLHGQAPASRVIVMGLRPVREDVASLIRAGVSGFIMAGAPFEVFLDTIHLVARGTKVLPEDLTASLFGQLHGHQNRNRLLSKLEVNSRLEVAAFALSVPATAAAPA
jgi:DNA-binding NarL/FixJ family response regulator